MGRLSPIRTLAQLRMAPIAPARALHTTPLARGPNPSDPEHNPPKAPREERAERVEILEPSSSKGARSSSPIYDNIMKGAKNTKKNKEDKDSVYSRLSHAEEDIRDAEKKADRIRAQARIVEDEIDAARAPVKLPPRRTWAVTHQDMRRGVPGYSPAKDYQKLDVVGGLGNWFEKPGMWGKELKPKKRSVWPASPEAKEEKNWRWKEVAVDALLGAVETIKGPAARAKVQEVVTAKQKGWMAKIPLDDLFVKFEISKRIVRRTGSAIPDAKLNDIYNFQNLYDLVTARPPPKTVFDALQRQVGGPRRDIVSAVNVSAKTVEDGKPRQLLQANSTGPALMRLPNVRVMGRRLTPVRRERDIGRWKVIEKEWAKRSLPIDKRMKKIPGAREKEWAWGKA